MEKFAFPSRTSVYFRDLMTDLSANPGMFAMREIQMQMHLKTWWCM
jgi:hypothetical protein